MGSIFRIFGWLLSLIVGLGVTLWGFRPHVFDQVVAKLGTFAADPGALAYAKLVGLIILAGCLFSVLFMKRSKKQESIRLSKERGDIIVNLASIEDALIRYGAQDPDVKKLKVDFAGLGKGLRIQVSCTIFEMENVPAKVEALQEILDRRFHEIMGPVGEGMKIDVSLDKIAKRSGSTPSPMDNHTPAIETTDVPTYTGGASFDGSVNYPTGDGDDNDDNDNNSEERREEEKAAS